MESVLESDRRSPPQADLKLKSDIEASTLKKFQQLPFTNHTSHTVQIENENDDSEGASATEAEEEMYGVSGSAPG